MRAVWICCLASCATPVAEIKTTIVVGDQDGRVYAAVGIDSGDTDVDASAVLRVGGQDIEVPWDGDILTTRVDHAPPVDDEQVELRLTIDGQTTSSVVTVPPALDLDADVPLFISRAQPLVLSRRTISDDPIHWSVNGACAKGYADIAGGVTALTATIEPLSDEYETCTTELYLDRKRAGSIDAAFASGTITYYRALHFLFASTP